MATKPVSTVLAAALLILALAFLPLAPVAEGNFLFPPNSLPYVSIRSDGSIDPATAPISRMGTLYTLTGNLTGYTLNIECDDIVVDGAGYTISSDNRSSPAIRMMHNNNVTVKNTRIAWFCSAHLSMGGCTNCTILNNTIITNAGGAMTLNGCNRCIITNNTIYNNDPDYTDLKGESIYCSDNHNTFSGNRFFGGEIGINLYGESNTVIRNMFTDVKTPVFNQGNQPNRIEDNRNVTSTQKAQENSWATMTSMPSADFVESAVVDGKIFIFGGPVTWVYNPADDSWAVKTPMPTLLEHFSAVTCASKVFVLGGVWNLSTITGENQAYDPETDTWETKTSMPTARYEMNAEAVNGKIYVVGGRTGGPKSSVNTTEVYDTATDTWTTKSPMLYPVVLYASTVLDGKIYVIGGQNEFSSEISSATTQVYNPETDRWSLCSSMPVSTLEAAAGATTGLAAPKRVYVMGGATGFIEGLTQNYAYDPQTDTWTEGTPIPTKRYLPTVAVVDDLLYVLGGGVEWTSPTAANERYVPFGYNASSLLSPSPTATPELSPSPSIPELPSWALLTALLAPSLTVTLLLKKKGSLER